MTDITVAIASTETSLNDVARQASGLAIGLQNVAPGEKLHAPNKSVQYLFEISESLNEFSGKCKKLLVHETKEQSDQLPVLMHEVVEHDKALREKYLIGDKFRFIRDRLNALFASVEETLNSLKKETTCKTNTIGEDEVLVYVYLFNAQGINLQTWNKLLTPSIFYDHSINRPIYTDKLHVEGFITRKANKTQHGYLTVAIKKQDISKTEGTESLKDVYDNPLIKVREGSLSFNKLIAFTHNGQDYIVNEEGGLMKKM